MAALGFDSTRLAGATGFTRIEALRDAVDALYTSDEAKRRFEIMARQVFMRFKALLMEPSAFRYAERHDNIEAIYKKLEEKLDTADVTELLKEPHIDLLFKEDVSKTERERLKQASKSLLASLRGHGCRPHGCSAVSVTAGAGRERMRARQLKPAISETSPHAPRPASG